MRRILVIGSKKTVCQLYEKEVRELFHGYLEVSSCSLEEVKTCSKEALASLKRCDIILMTSPYALPAVRQWLNPTASVVNLTFTFLEEKLKPLKQLPRNTDVLLCFNYYGPAYQTAYILYGMGVENVNLFIYYPNSPELLGKKVEIAVVSNQTERVPDWVKQVINLGDRKLSFTTIIEIATCAGVLNKQIEERIQSYSSKLASPDTFVSSIYNLSSTFKVQLQSIIDCIDYSILILDKNDNIINHNQNFLELFQLKETIHNKNLFDLNIHPAALRILAEHPFANDVVVTFKPLKKQLMFSKIRTKDGNTYILLLKEVTDIINRDTNVRKQIAKKGYVAKYLFSDIKGDSQVIRDCLKKARKIACIDKPVLILGESGTGKELFAQSIHNESQRRTFPFIAINCATLPTELLESELFGYVEGAFTGARKGGKLGLFQMAHKGTLFLDEIGEMSLSTQAALLRVLEEKKIMKVGGDEIIDVDVRIVVATNRNLERQVKRGEFRLDLYYRLNTLTICIPPLRERAEDVKVLIEDLVKQEGMTYRPIDKELMRFFTYYEWSGNVRELRNCVDYMFSIADGPVVTAADLPEYLQKQYENYIRAPGKEYLAPVLEELEEALPLLRILCRGAAGRQRLLAEMAKEGYPCSEYKMRLLLERLKNAQYIEVGKGRSGNRITMKGRRLLAESLQNSDQIT